MKLAALAAMASVPETFRELSGWKSGMTLLVLAFLAGIGAAGIVAQFGTHEKRIVALEEWRDIHTDTVTGPGLRRIRNLMSAQEETSQRLGRMETMVRYMCAELVPERCPPPTLEP
jgi:hypothetical protein